jgi:hypothetical protein
MSRPSPDRRALLSRIFRVISWRGSGLVAVGSISAGYAMTAMALTGAASTLAAGSVPEDSIKHIEFVLWFGGALLILAGVAAASVRIFVVPAVEKQFAAHVKDADAHAVYLKLTDWTKSHDTLMGRINDVGNQVAGIGGQLRQDIRTDRRADAQAEAKG